MSAVTTCAICIEPVDDGIETDCGHAFHDDCLRGWAKHCQSHPDAAAATCPICRHPLRADGHAHCCSVIQLLWCFVAVYVAHLLILVVLILLS